MTTDVKPLVFENREGMRLMGILHRPVDYRRDIGVLILSPGIKSRVAPHRLYVKMANKFSNMGFSVLRFDPHGIGDSEGDVEERMAADFYGTVQVGRFVNDTIDAMDWMQREVGITRFVLTGLCGGAITGLLAGAMDRRVHMLMGLGMPVTLDNAKTDQTRYMTWGQLHDVRGTYLRKLLDPKAWGRFLTLKSDYRLILKSVATKRNNHGSRPRMNWTIQDAVRDDLRAEKSGASNNLNPYFPIAFHSMLESRRVTLIFSGADRLHWEFEEKYLGSHAKEFRRLQGNLDMHVIEKANHVLTFKEWQDEMLAILASGLERFVEPGGTMHVS
jgi:hypothetical protein